MRQQVCLKYQRIHLRRFVYALSSEYDKRASHLRRDAPGM